MSSYPGSFVYTRRSPRVNVELPADFRILLPKKDLERYSLNIKSLSGGGLSFLSPIPLALGTRLEMTLHNHSVQINFTAEVIWTEKVPDSRTKKIKCGLMFTQISDEDLAYLYHIISNYPGNSNPSS